MARRIIMIVASVALLSAGFAAGLLSRSGFLSGIEEQPANRQQTAELPQIFRDCPDCPEMVPVPGHSFAAGRYEVTRGQWAMFVEDTGRHVQPVQYEAWTCDWQNPGFEQDDTHPVTCVSWYDAQAYVQWLSMRTGEHYRLLSGEEWRIAARGGTKTKYWWGDQDPVCDQSPRTPNGANFSLCADDRTRPVGSFQPNGYGLYDVHGNVSEWVEDCRAERPFSGVCGNEPACSEAGWIERLSSDLSCGSNSYRAFILSSWDAEPSNLQFTRRESIFWHPGMRDDSTGFRLGRSM